MKHRASKSDMADLRRRQHEIFLELLVLTVGRDRGTLPLKQSLQREVELVMELDDVRERLGAHTDGA
ncbi:MAG: hypothetical protein HY716_05020 [Planctomycetes bacterium]|nr:hypothetical protein [Planctomycetota bacterium]